MSIFISEISQIRQACMCAEPIKSFGRLPFVQSYTYNDDSLITSETRDSDNYTYDGLDRLTKTTVTAVDNPFDITYTYYMSARSNDISCRANFRLKQVHKRKNKARKSKWKNLGYGEQDDNNYMLLNLRVF